MVLSLEVTMMPLVRRAWEVAKALKPWRIWSDKTSTSASEPLQNAPVSANAINHVALPLISVRMLAMLVE